MHFWGHIQHFGGSDCILCISNHNFPLQHNCYLTAFILPLEAIRQSFSGYFVCSIDSPWERTFSGTSVTAWSSVLDWIVPGSSQFLTSAVSWSVAAGVHKVFSLCSREKLTTELAKADIISCSVAVCCRSLLSRVKGDKCSLTSDRCGWRHK